MKNQTAINSAKFTKWNVFDGMDTKEAVAAFLTAACETPEDKEHICRAIAVAVEAIKTYNIKMVTDAEQQSLHEDALSVKQSCAQEEAVPA